MDYVLQIEKLLKYLELNLEFQDMYFVKNLIRRFNNDLNLFGCFLKDFLIITNDGKISNDEEIYNDFVLYFEKTNFKKTLLKLDDLSNFYLMIVFEECNDEELISVISTINACFSLQHYPYLMKLMSEYQDNIIDGKLYSLMLKSLTDDVIKNFDSQEHVNNIMLKYENDKIELKTQLGKIAS